MQIKAILNGIGYLEVPFLVEFTFAVSSLAVSQWCVSTI